MTAFTIIPCSFIYKFHGLELKQRTLKLDFWIIKIKIHIFSRSVLCNLLQRATSSVFHWAHTFPIYLYPFFCLLLKNDMTPSPFLINDMVHIQQKLASTTLLMKAMGSALYGNLESQKFGSWNAPFKRIMFLFSLPGNKADILIQNIAIGIDHIGSQTGMPLLMVDSLIQWIHPHETSYSSRIFNESGIIFTSCPKSLINIHPAFSTAAMPSEKC